MGSDQDDNADNIKLILPYLSVAAIRRHENFGRASQFPYFTEGPSLPRYSRTHHLAAVPHFKLNNLAPVSPAIFRILSLIRILELRQANREPSRLARRECAGNQGISVSTCLKEPEPQVANEKVRTLEQSI